MGSPLVRWILRAGLASVLLLALPVLSSVMIDASVVQATEKAEREGVAHNPGRLTREDCVQIIEVYDPYNKVFNEKIYEEKVIGRLGPVSSWEPSYYGSDKFKYARWLSGCETLLFPNQHMIHSRWKEKLAAIQARIQEEWDREWSARLANEKKTQGTFSGKLAEINKRIDEAPATEEGLRELEEIDRAIRKDEELRKSSGDLVTLQENIKKQYEKNKVAVFDLECPLILGKTEFPIILEKEKVSSLTHWTSTLGRVYCTAIKGGGTVKFQSLSGSKQKSVGISVKKTEKEFTIIFNKRMTPDLHESWVATSIQTASDSKTLTGSESITTMAMFPELVKNETK
jgi:hypothetical protein